MDGNCGYDFGGDSCATLKTELKSSLGFTMAADVFTYSEAGGEDAGAGEDPAEDPAEDPNA